MITFKIYTYIFIHGKIDYAFTWQVTLGAVLFSGYEQYKQDKKVKFRKRNSDSVHKSRLYAKIKHKGKTNRNHINTVYRFGQET